MSRLTVGEIAARIARPGESLDAVRAKLVNWTKEGLLRTTGEKHTGKGRHRYYAETAVVDAFILNEFTEWGIPAVLIANMHAKQIETGKPLQFLRYARTVFEKAGESDPANEWCWLFINRNRDEKLPPTAIFFHTQIPFPIPTGKKIFEVLPSWSPSSIVLNLTEMFTHLRKNLGEQ